MTADEIAAALAGALPALVLVAALFATSTRRGESHVRLHLAGRGALALLLAVLGLERDEPVLGLIAAARIAVAWRVAEALLHTPARTRPAERGTASVPFSLAALGGVAALGYAATAGLGSFLGPGEVAFRAAGAVLLVGLFSAALGPPPLASATGALSASDGVGLAVVSASVGAPSFALLAGLLDVLVSLAVVRLHRLRALPPGARP